MPTRLRQAASVLAAMGMAAAMLADPAAGQEPPDGPPETCSAEVAPTPTAVAVTSVPAAVTSTADDYFVLYVRFGTGDAPPEMPVAVVQGEDGTTTLAENVEALPAARYRVEKYSITDPADVDGDCVDDITELTDPSASPVNPATVAAADGVVQLPDRAAFESVARKINGQPHAKFVITGLEDDEPHLYFVNQATHPTHNSFNRVIDARWTPFNATLVYDSSIAAPDGTAGAYYFLPDTTYVLGPLSLFEIVSRAYTMLAANMGFLDDDLLFNIPDIYLLDFQDHLSSLRESRIDVVFDHEIFLEENYLALHLGESYGYLRELDPDDRAGPRDIVVYDALPNDLPRVAGIISTVPQTPLSHVNLRAIQDDTPNAVIPGFLDDEDIEALLDRPVAYSVTRGSWSVRAATVEEVDAHHDALRPSAPQTPSRDLSVTEITPLCQVGFDDWEAFGVKAANVAVLRTLGFAAGTVPDGFAVPFYFYDEFMKANDLYTRIDEMLAVENFYTDLDVQEDQLKALRKEIKDAETPEWITTGLVRLHSSFPSGTSLRYRSSTNNEDLPGFNGAGLYDSKTQHPDETVEDGIDKSLKQVYASLWNFRAFVEREFYRIDHKAAAMGVLVHPNYSDELANGVAVSFDPFDRIDPEYGDGDYYVNTQLGEDLVTNPEAHSIPEELLLGESGHRVLGLSNLVERGELLLNDSQLDQLRDHLETIHDRFEQLYGAVGGEPFAIEIEFKITSDNILAIKQARPWVFPDAVNTRSSRPPATQPAGCGPSRPTLSSDTTLPIASTRPSPGTGGGVVGGGGGASSGSGRSGGGASSGGGSSGRSGGAPPEPEFESTFVDIDLAGVHQEAIETLEEAGLLEGTACGRDKFCPNQPILRWVVAMWLVRLLDGTDAAPDGTLRFTDADPQRESAPFIERLAELEVTLGCQTEPERLFCPYEPVTRAQMASFIARALDLSSPDDPADFEDVAANDVHAPDIRALYAAGITNGCHTGAQLRFCPHQHTTRAEMASFVNRARQVLDSR